MSSLWFPGANLSHRAPVDGGSILGGRPKCLWHDTETQGLPSYSTGYFPNMTICGSTPYQHIPADRAARALRNPAGGVQTNRWNVFQIEVCGYANRVQFQPVMRDVAQWLKEARGCPLTCSVDWMNYPDSYGIYSRVRLSGAAWLNYTGHLGHQHAPENDHGDPGAPFPIADILDAQQEEADMTPEQAKQLQYIYDTLTSTADGQPLDLLSKLYRLTTWGTEAKGEGRPNLADVLEELRQIKAQLGPPA